MAEKDEASPAGMLPGGQVVVPDKPSPGGQTMIVRFFNGDGPEGPRLLIGLSFEAEQIPAGQMSEAVRVATEDDVKLHEAAYQEYLAKFPAVEQAAPTPVPAPGRQATTPATATPGPSEQRRDQQGRYN